MDSVHFKHVLRVFSVLTFTFLGACAEVNNSVPPWPDYMGFLLPSRSEAGAVAQLPPDVKITRPDASTSSTTPKRAQLLGVFWGWACPYKNTDVKVAVESLEKDHARIAIGVFSPSSGTSILRGGETARFDAQYVSETELLGTIKPGWEVRLRLRGDGYLEILSWRPPIRCGGLLSRIPDQQQQANQ